MELVYLGDPESPAVSDFGSGAHLRAWTSLSISLPVLTNTFHLSDKRSKPPTRPIRYLATSNLLMYTSSRDVSIPFPKHSRQQRDLVWS